MLNGVRADIFHPLFAFEFFFQQLKIKINGHLIVREKIKKINCSAKSREFMQLLSASHRFHERIMYAI